MEGPEFEPITAERIVGNEAVFRDANERIRAWAAAREMSAEVFPVVCECADPGCREVLVVSLVPYDAVRAIPTHFIVAPGHEAVAGESVEVVVEKPAYVVVEKIGRAAENAVELADGSAS
jgi:hypothetical protein